MKFRNLYLIEVFHAVMKTGSMTGAARLLNLSQPSVTKYIQTLEGLIGTELFVREGRGISPTPTAIIMFDEVHALFDQANNIYRLMESVSRSARRRVRVGVPPILGSRFIADVVSQITRLQDGFDLYIVEKDSAILKGWINAGRLDLAIVSEHASGSGISVAKTPMVCIMPVDHPLAAREQVDVADLLEHNYVAFESDSPVQMALDLALREFNAKIYPRAVATTTPTLVELVAAGFGISVVHPFALINAHAPVAQRAFAPAVPWSYKIITSPTLRNSSLVAEFVSAIETCAADWLTRLKTHA